MVGALGRQRKYSWRDGEDVVFDDTYEHDVHNNTEHRRIILFCDLRRPQKSAFSNWLVDQSIKLIAPLTTRANDKQEKVTKTL